MGKIKFRAWDKNKSYMIWNSDGVDDEAAYDEWWGPQEKIAFEGLEYLAEADHLVLMQYTGLKDKNGKEIYEGDIIKSGDAWGVFKWTNEALAFEIYENNHPSFVPVGAFYGHDGESLDSWESLEVIGNIYENPELLKEE